MLRRTIWLQQRLKQVRIGLLLNQSVAAPFAISGPKKWSRHFNGRQKVGKSGIQSLNRAR
jgi:hypothetical protein